MRVCITAILLTVARLHMHTGDWKEFGLMEYGGFHGELAVVDGRMVSIKVTCVQTMCPAWHSILRESEREIDRKRKLKVEFT